MEEKAVLILGEGEKDVVEEKTLQHSWGRGKRKERKRNPRNIPMG